jgi:uncharacterized membrane protein
MVSELISTLLSFLLLGAIFYFVGKLFYRLVSSNDVKIIYYNIVICLGLFVSVPALMATAMMGANQMPGDMMVPVLSYGIVIGIGVALFSLIIGGFYTFVKKEEAARRVLRTPIIYAFFWVLVAVVSSIYY